MQRTRPKLIPKKLTPEDEAYIRDTEPTLKFLWNLPEDILTQYRGKWIAAKNCEVIASAETRAELEDKLEDPYDRMILFLQLPKGPRVL